MKRNKIKEQVAYDKYLAASIKHQVMIYKYENVQSWIKPMQFGNEDQNANN